MERTYLLTSFQDFGLADPISRALKEENYLTPTSIQAQTIPLALTGRDVLGIPHTGTGQSGAVLGRSPPRVLWGQIVDNLNAFGRHIRLTSTLAIGGVPMGRQVRSL